MYYKRFKMYHALLLCLIVCAAFFGMYYEFCGATMTIVLAAIILVYVKNCQRIYFKITIGSTLYLIFLLCHLLTTFYGTDRGMIFLGIGKILWIAPFLLLYQQLATEQRRKLFSAIPWIGMGIVIVGMLGLMISPLEEVFWVNHRLGGTFQYPNTLAIFLLMGIIVLLYEEYTDWSQTLCFAILCIGIAATGSRIVMVISVLAIGVIGIIRKKRTLCLLFMALVAAGVCYILATGDTATVGRMRKLSFSESTFVGRFLYSYDAFGLLLRHPFGMGYLGYYYVQNMIQTGVYSVRYVHNDLLQIGLDIGWVPMLAYVWAIFKCICSKAVSADQKWILIVVFVHGLFDFDLAYTVILCLMFIIMDNVRIEKSEAHLPEAVSVKGGGVLIASAVIITVAIYLTIPTIAVYQENYQLAAKVYPWHTEANLHLLSESDDIDEVEQMADRILKQNDTCALAYYAKAYAAYCMDDYQGVIEFQRECIARDYFNYEEYLNYAVMLYDGIQFADDEMTREQCKAELRNIPKLLEWARQRVSFLGSRIKDQPKLEVDEQLREMIAVGG